MTFRLALYARYSTDLQREASIDDQLRLCQAYASRQGWIVAGCYHDRAISRGPPCCAQAYRSS